MPPRKAPARALPGMARLAAVRETAPQRRSTSRWEDELAFAIRAVKLPTPERNAKFHPTRKWAVDFLWREEKIAVEVEGGTWAQSRHTHPIGFEKDAEKYNELALAGFMLLRVTSKMVEDGRALHYVWRALGGADAVRRASNSAGR